MREFVNIRWNMNSVSIIYLLTDWTFTICLTSHFGNEIMIVRSKYHNFIISLYLMTIYIFLSQFITYLSAWNLAYFSEINSWINAKYLPAWWVTSAKIHLQRPKASYLANVSFCFVGFFALVSFMHLWIFFFAYPYIQRVFQWFISLVQSLSTFVDRLKFFTFASIVSFLIYCRFFCIFYVGFN